MPKKAVTIGERFEKALKGAKFTPVYYLHPDDRITDGEETKLAWREPDGTVVRVTVARTKE